MEGIIIVLLVLIATLLLGGKAEGHSGGGCITKEPPKSPKPDIRPKPYGKNHLVKREK